MAIYVEIMSKIPLFFRSVGRGPPPSLPFLWWKGPPGKPRGSSTGVTHGQYQWAVPLEATTEDPNFAASATDRRALTCLHNYPKTQWQHTLMLHTMLGTNQSVWHRAAREEFRQQSAINPCPVTNSHWNVVYPPALQLLVPPCKAYRQRWKKMTIPACFMARC